MESQVLALLAAQQSSATIKQSEDQLNRLYPNEELPLAFVSIATNTSIELSLRQAALLNLKNYVLAGWSPELEDFNGQVLLSDAAKVKVRDILLDLSTQDGVDRKVQTAASLVVSKIAVADYPEQWPGLLQHLLQIIQSSPSDARLHGTLKVLFELADGLEEQQFFLIARELVDALYTVAADANRSFKIRALAVSVFKGCFETLQTLMEEHKAEIKTFAEQSLVGWMALLLGIINTPLSDPPNEPDVNEDGPMEAYRGLVALKVQVARVLIAIRVTFPSVLAPQTPALFSAVWSELTRLQSLYQKTFVEEDIESQSIDVDGLPYSLDFLVLENLDFLQGSIRAPPVRRELEARSSSQTVQESWIVELMKLTTHYSQITEEESGMWDLDVNVFLAEETSVTANYTTRTACGDLVVKVGEWQREKSVEGLLYYVRDLFAQGEIDLNWRLKEAALFNLDVILRDWADYGRTLPVETGQAFVDIARSAQLSSHSFLRARGHTVVGAVVRAAPEKFQSAAAELFNKNLQGVLGDKSESVQISCIRAIPSYLGCIPQHVALPLQTPIIQAMQQWLSNQVTSELRDSEELLFTLVESLRAVITLDAGVCLTGDGLSLLFVIANSGAENFQMTSLVDETFEDICSVISSRGRDAYTQLCTRVLPSLTGAFDVGSMTEENALMSLSASLLSSLTEAAPSPLPAGFVSATVPKLLALLLNHTDDELLKTCTICLKNILTHDPEQLLSFSSTASTPPKSGLELVLSVVDRLLSPAIDDNAAAEVGGLAAALVEKAGPEKLGQYLLPLLRAVASRVATAEKADLIQNLTLVFARLAAQNPHDVVDFLAQVQIESGSAGAAAPTPALPAVMAKWLDNCGSFAGYDAIRLNLLALSRLWELRDARLAAVEVKGDLIVPESARIVTRSRAKANPDRFTAVPVPVKIVKVLVEELGAGGSAGLGVDGAARAAAGAADSDGEGDVSDDEDGADPDDWEDVDSFAGLTGMDKMDLLRFADEVPGSAARPADAETQAFLERFFKGLAADADFQAVFAQLNTIEQGKLQTLLA